jgi:hypothetical protein
VTIKDIGPKPQSFDLEHATLENENYRAVAWSGRYLVASPSAGMVDVAPMPDSYHEHEEPRLDDLIDDSIDALADPVAFLA